MYWQGVLLVAIIVEAGQERHGGVQGGEGFGSVHLLMSQRRGIRCHVLLDLDLREVLLIRFSVTFTAAGTMRLV